MEASTKALWSIQSILIKMQLIKGSNYTCLEWVGGLIGLPVIIGLTSVQLQIKLQVCSAGVMRL